MVIRLIKKLKNQSKSLKDKKNGIEVENRSGEQKGWIWGKQLRGVLCGKNGGKKNKAEEEG